MSHRAYRRLLKQWAAHGHLRVTRLEGFICIIDVAELLARVDDFRALHEQLLGATSELELEH